MPRARLFGTLFYANYLTRALALYRSLEAHFVGDFTLVMLCMDDAARRAIEQLKLKHVEALPIHDLECTFRELATVKSQRSIAEYSWTATPFLLRWLLGRVTPGEAVVYLDADMMFYSDAQPLFDEWGGADIAIHEHRYAPSHHHYEQTSGRFNVGWVGIRNSEQGKRCVTRWAGQCIELCVHDAARGLCGDQTYLDEWPSLYDRLVILQHKGAGLGPWNIGRYAMSDAGTMPQVDGMPVVFYHFSALRIIHANLFGHLVIIPALGYRFAPIQRRLIYRPYAQRLREAARDIRMVGAAEALVDRRPTWPEIRAMRRGILVV